MRPYIYDHLTLQEKQEHWVSNLLVAHAVMTEMPDESIYPKLGDWCKDKNDCGSPACFGGWVARIPYFQSQGITGATWSGAPRVDNRSASYVGEYLFGSVNMFDYRAGHNKAISDRQFILNRIERQINSIQKENN